MMELEDIKEWWGNQNSAPDASDTEEEALRIISKYEKDSDTPPSKEQRREQERFVQRAINWVEDANIEYAFYLKEGHAAER